MNMNQSKLRVRKATLDDWTEVKRICKDIWGGEDYVPDNFPEWLQSNNCQPFVLEDLETGFLRGVVNIRVIDQGETAWFEGIRIDPTYQGRGLGSILTRFIVNWSIQNLPSVKQFRLMIAEENRPSLKLAHKFGLHPVTTAIYFRLDIAKQQDFLEKFTNKLDKKRNINPNEMTVKKMDDEQTIIQFYLKTWKERTNVNAILVGWSFISIKEENIKELLKTWHFIAATASFKNNEQFIAWKIEVADEQSPSIRVIFHASDEAFPHLVPTTIAYLHEKHPEITIFRCHAQVTGKKFEAMLDAEEKKNINFFRFYLLERMKL